MALAKSHLLWLGSALCLAGSAWATPGVTVVTPATGLQVAPGSTVRVLVEVDPSLNPGTVRVRANISTRIPSLSLPAAPYEGFLQIPNTLTGPISIDVSVEPANPSEEDGFVGTESFVLNVVPSGSPVQMYEAHRESIRLEYPASVSGGDTGQLTMRGVYLSGIERDLSKASTGTQYSSSNPALVAVSPDGHVTSHAPGFALVTVQNSGVVAYVDVMVNGTGYVSPPAVEVSDVSVSAGGFRVDPQSGIHSQQITIRNTGTVPLFQPLKLLVSGLPAGVALENNARPSRFIAPGSGTVNVPLGGPDDLLAPGASTTVTLRFSNSAGRPITHALRVFRGAEL